MTLDPKVSQRLNNCIQPALYEVCQGQTHVREELEADNSAATVTCHLPADATCIRWKLESPHLFPFLKDRLAADGALMLERADGTYEAHVMECKLTINQDTWTRAKRQMRWSLIRLQALAGALDVKLTRMRCYTAYRHERWEKGLLKLPIGEVHPQDPSQEEAAELLLRQADWVTPEIELRGFDVPLAHQKVQLDPQQGTGQASLG